MHFLCLHGAGTSSKIFEAQTALRYEIGGDHTFDFVEGVVLQPKAAGIDSFTTAHQQHFAYYEPAGIASLDQALDQLRRYVLTDGPFDGVLGFSQGAALASSFIMQEARLGRQPFQCAIFVSGSLELLDHGPQSCRDAYAICIPTAHIWGLYDMVTPGQANALHALCQPETAVSYQHPGGHEVPGSRAKDALLASANAVNRMLAFL